MNNGYIYLHKKILNWEWWDDVNVAKIFIHCLLRANWSDKRWKGKVIKRGEFITSSIKMAKENGISRQQVRTALEKLQATNEITKSATSNYTRIKVNNYDDYQKITNKITNEQPTDNQRITSTNEERIKNNKEGKKASSKKKLSSKQRKIYNGLSEIDRAMFDGGLATIVNGELRLSNKFWKKAGL